MRVQQLCTGSKNSAFLTCSQVMQELFLLGPHFGVQIRDADKRFIIYFLQNIKRNIKLD